MGSAATIVFAREDLSIPGAPISARPSMDHADAVRKRFFALVSDSKPDVIVLDFSSAPSSGTDTILTVRRRSAVPILVVCNPGHPLAKKYRTAGAAGCISAPLDILCLSRAIRGILRDTGDGRAHAKRGPVQFSFAEMTFQIERNVLVTNNGPSVVLTNSEGRLLAHLLSRPWVLCSRAEIHELLYGRDHAVGSRALDAVVNRLRKKLSCLGRPPAKSLIKTKLRCGYWLAADVTTLPQSASTRPW